MIERNSDTYDCDNSEISFLTAIDSVQETNDEAVEFKI